MATRAGAVGNLPFVRGTTGPSQILKAPRGAQHKAAINAELAAEATKIGGKQFIQKYGLASWTAINSIDTQNQEFEKNIKDIDEGKDKEEEVNTELSTEVKEEPPKLPEEEPEGPDIGTELATEAAIQTKKVLEKKEDITPGIGHNQPPSAIEEQTKELLGENLTVDTVLDKNLLDELLVMRDGIKGFNKRMSSSFAPLPNSTKSKMIIVLQDKLFNKYNLDKYPEGKTPENTTKEEQEALKKKFNTQLQGIEYIVSAAYDAIPREGTSAVDKVTKQDIANGYSVFTLDNEGLPIAGAKIKKFIKSHGGDPEGPDPKEERAPAVYITEMGSITTNATSKLLNKIIEIAKENNINYVVAEDLTSKEALEAFKKRGFQSTLRKEYKKFKGKKIRRPTNNRLILQKNLVLKINKELEKEQIQEQTEKLISKIKDPPITKEELQELDDIITDKQISRSYKSSKSFGDEVRKTQGTKLTKRGRKK